jgi:hypothetical protein
MLFKNSWMSFENFSGRTPFSSGLGIDVKEEPLILLHVCKDTGDINATASLHFESIAMTKF